MDIHMKRQENPCKNHMAYVFCMELHPKHRAAAPERDVPWLAHKQDRTPDTDSNSNTRSNLADVTQDKHTRTHCEVLKHLESALIVSHMHPLV